MKARGLPYFELKHQAEEFLYREAELLDQRRFNEWLELFTEDAEYVHGERRSRCRRARAGHPKGHTR